MNIDITYYSKQTRDALISQTIAPSGPVRRPHRVEQSWLR
jgi:hypothetical protein